MAYEISEICTAAALMFTTTELEKLKKGFNSGELNREDLVEKLEQAKEDMQINKPKAKVGQVVFTDGAQQQGFMNLIKKPDDKALDNFAKGISAALGIRNFVRKKGDNQPTKKVFMNGSKWPQEIEKFSLPEGSFNYNSADILVENNSAKTKVKKYYCISLKKKNTSAAKPPPLINKAFDTVVEGDKDFKKLLNELNQDKYKFFADLLKKIIGKGKLLQLDKRIKMPSIDEEIFNMKIKNPYKGGNIRLISIKNEGIVKPEYNMKKAGDKALADRLFAIGLPEAKWKVRQYFNQALYGGGKSKYWQGVLKKLNEHSEKFAEALIDVILKVNLYDRLKKKDVDESEFDFQVTTGTGGVTPKGKVTINDSTNFPINTLLCGYNRIQQKEFKNKKWNIKLRDEVDEDGKPIKGDTMDKAAKIKMWLMKGDDQKVLDLELRYKGKFGQQPQFTGTIHPDFKKLLDKECFN